MTPAVVAAPLLRPGWRQARAWFGLAAVVVVGAILVGTLSTKPGRPLDPASPHPDGSKALVRILVRYGVTVSATSSVPAAVRRDAASAVLVAQPDDYSAAQLRHLAAAAGRLVLVAPGTRAAAAVDPSIQPDPQVGPRPAPGCPDPGAKATGPVDFPLDTVTYLAGHSGAVSCYAGALLTEPRLAVLGSAELLQNRRLADRGVAALDVNAITDSRRFGAVVWLLPGADAAGPGPASVWDLFPPAAHRAFWWLIAVGVLLVLWRARRLGGVVAEPLPVVVRAAEIVEGHGRLYARAGARERASAALRGATVGRLAHRLGLPRGASAEQVAVAAAGPAGSAPVHDLLAGPPPRDDAALLRLAHDLDELEARTPEGERH